MLGCVLGCVTDLPSISNCMTHLMSILLQNVHPQIQDFVIDSFRLKVIPSSSLSVPAATQQKMCVNPLSTMNSRSVALMIPFGLHGLLSVSVGVRLGT